MLESLEENSKIDVANNLTTNMILNSLKPS